MAGSDTTGAPRCGDGVVGASDAAMVAYTALQAAVFTGGGGWSGRAGGG